MTHPKRSKQTEVEEDLYYHLRVAAHEFILGKSGPVTRCPEDAHQILRAVPSQPMPFFLQALERTAGAFQLTLERVVSGDY